ncbi:S41 family peptidase [Tundrisphaera lichenicola]|uniref:S41 family peptidase n=1 Tax=Tundrisphaera lichenicola TaxID=2029860 RepID=UPI003EB96AEA
MKLQAIPLTGWLTLAMWFGCYSPSTGQASPLRDVAPSVEEPASPEDASTVYARGLDLEREHKWSAAAQVYREAKIRWPSRPEFTQRYRLAEMHSRLARRYQDASFRNVLLRLDHEKSFDLFDELIERIESHYVDPVPLEPLIRRGYDNLEVALRDPRFSFLALNAPGASPERITWLREQLRGRRDRLSVPDRDSARDQVLAACELARQALSIPTAAIVLEFVFGSCDVLDDYTSYLTPNKLDDMFAMIDGNFVGLGVELKLDDQGLKLVGVLRGGPASEAGLKAGDRIVAVGGQSVKGLGLDEAAGRLQGTEGTIIDISVLLSDDSTRNLKLIRRHVDVESVEKARIVEPISGVGYIQLTGFQKTSTEELDRAIGRLRREGMRYLVLDLRGNPGGLLNVAVDIADRFVDQGIIVSTRGRAPGQTQVYRAKPDKPYTMPVAILIDRDSASASEILAGALQELGRAVVIGDRSYGKGSVQSIFELRSAPAGLKLTTAKFYSPRNRPYSEQGVTPDVQVTTRAKPTSDQSSELEPQDFGNLETDPVLRMALQRAQRQLTANR